MIIETIKVKPTGFLASWRYVNVEVDEDGVITNSNVPGKPVVNLDFISDYNSNNRAYANGSLITTFCDYETFKRYNIYAQDERPFAYATDVIDDPTCGYETPLPEVVPPNPFGEPSYGLYRTFDYCSDTGLDINVSISKKGFEGEVTLIETGDKTPVKLSYKPVDKKTDVIRPLECTLSFINSDDLLLSEFYTEDERTFMVEVEYDGLLVFKGYVIPDSCSEPFANANYPISIKCTDGLGSLKAVTYPLPTGSTFDMEQSFKDIICYCLAPLNINLPISTICNVYELSMPNGLNDDPLALASINPLRLADDSGKTLTCYEALKSVCEAWGMYIAQVNGKWILTRYNEPSKLVVRQRNYSYKGLFITAENTANDREVSNSNSTDYVALAGGVKEIEGGYKRVQVLSSFGKVPSILYNGDFEAWNGFNFAYWTKYGGIDISRIQRFVINTVGAPIPIQNYALQFNKRNDIGKYLQHSPIPIQIGDKAKLTYRVGKTPTNATSAAPTFTTFKMIIKLGEYYLYNKDGGNTYTWEKSLTYVINRVDNPKGDLNTFTVGFEMPEAPTGGNMIVQLYGFGDGLEASVTGTYTYDLVGTIDDMTITKTSQSGENDVIGTLNITDNLRYYTNKPDVIEILFGDYFERPLATQELDNLYAIYVNGSYSKGWIEYGISGQPVSFGMALAKSILRAYQVAFVNWNGELLIKGVKPFNYLDVLNFITPSEPTFNLKRFMFLGVDIDLKTNRLYNVKMAEVFDNTMISVDNTVPYYPNAPEPIFIQDSNYVKVTGIFTDEFTQEFN